MSCVISHLWDNLFLIQFSNVEDPNISSPCQAAVEVDEVLVEVDEMDEGDKVSEDVDEIAEIIMNSPN